MACFAPELFASFTQHRYAETSCFVQETLFRGNRSGSWRELAFYIRLFVLDFFRHDEKEVVETVCLVIFPMTSLNKYQVSNLNEKRIKAVVLGPENSDAEMLQTFWKSGLNEFTYI